MASDNDLNQAKVITAQAMLKEGFITEQQYKNFVSNYAFIIREAGMWDKILEKIWGRPKDDSRHYELVKVIVVDDNQHEAMMIVDRISVPEQPRFERLNNE